MFINRNTFFFAVLLWKYLPEVGYPVGAGTRWELEPPAAAAAAAGTPCILSSDIHPAAPSCSSGRRGAALSLTEGVTAARRKTWPFNVRQKSLTRRDMDASSSFLLLLLVASLSCLPAAADRRFGEWNEPFVICFFYHLPPRLLCSSSLPFCGGLLFLFLFCVNIGAAEQPAGGWPPHRSLTWARKNKHGPPALRLGSNMTAARFRPKQQRNVRKAAWSRRCATRRRRKTAGRKISHYPIRCSERSPL